MRKNLHGHLKFEARLTALCNQRGLYCSPDPPDLDGTAAASLEVGLEQVALGREQLAWAKEIGAEQLDLAREILGTQTGIMRENQLLAVEDRNRYRATFGAMEDDLVNQAKNYATPARQEAEAGKASSDVIQAYDKVRATQIRQQGAFGIDPTSGAALANNRKMNIAQARDMAHGANTARKQVEDMGWAKQLDAVSLGRNLPAQASTSYGIALNAGNSAVGNMNNTVGSVGNNRSAAQGWYQGGANAIGQSANILNAGYANEIAAQNSTLGAIGGLVGMGAGIAMRSSSKKVKTNKHPIEGEVLERLEDVPVERWRYKEGVEDSGVREHVGPYAEDFTKAFGTGDGKSIDLMDAVGVSMAATKELARKVAALEQKLGFGLGD